MDINQILNFIESKVQIQVDPFMWFLVMAQAIQAIWFYQLSRKSDAKDKKIENYLRLKETFRSLWYRLTAHPEQNKVLLSKSIDGLEKVENAEMVKLTVFQVLDLFNDVHFYYKHTTGNMDKSEWEKTINFVMSHKIFTTAFFRHQETYSDDFKSFIEGVITNHGENKILEPKTEPSTSPLTFKNVFKKI